MIEQFVAFSTGRMKSAEDQSLRAEMGSWPDRYWNAFPPVIRLIIKDLLEGNISEEEFRSKIQITLEMNNP
jgi:hypothetical protein